MAIKQRLSSAAATVSQGSTQLFYDRVFFLQLGSPLLSYDSPALSAGNRLFERKSRPWLDFLRRIRSLLFHCRANNHSNKGKHNMGSAVTVTPAEAADLHDLKLQGVKSLTVEQVMRFQQLSESTVYQQIRSKTLPSMKIGRCRRIPIAAYEAWVAKQMKQV